tara:strand:+ start:2649 stop:3308 length:660 start_codon:yes stop_codon:yes gene_type:complete
MNYNTSRPHLIIPEYGRHIQKMIDHAVGIEDSEERQKVAVAVINVMGTLNPHLRDVPDFTHKLWDHLFIMSDFRLKVESPYPMPVIEELVEKPKHMAYPQSNIRFKHYGKGVESLIDVAVEKEDGEEKDALVIAIANLMKKFYLSFNRDSVEDKLILNDLNRLSKGNLSLPEDTELESTNAIIKTAGLNTSKSNFQKKGKKRSKSNNNSNSNNYKKKKY